MKKLFYLFILFPLLVFCKPIEDVVRENLAIEKAKIKKNAIDDIVEGGKLASIYFVEDLDRKKTVIIKRFDKEQGGLFEYQKEKEAYAYLSSKNYQYLHFPSLIQAFEDEEYAYLIINKAEGMTINSLIKKRNKLNLFERHALDREIHDAMEKTAKAIHELHTKNHCIPKKFIQENSHEPKRYVHKITASMRNKKQVESNFFHLRNQMLNKKIAFGLTHGDLHMGNIFYDQKLGQVTLIDFATLSGKADQLSKIPIAEDIGIFIAHFEAIGAIHDLKEHEINRFIETFKKSYPGYERMSIEVEYYRFMSHLRLYELSQDPSGHTNIDKQLKKILVYSKKAISSSAA
jgi:serine/threonine protein kinase